MLFIQTRCCGLQVTVSVSSTTAFFWHFHADSTFGWNLKHDNSIQGFI